MVLQDAWLPQLAQRVDSVIITASPRGQTQCPRDVPEASLKFRLRRPSASTFVVASAVRKLRTTLGQCKKCLFYKVYVRFPCGVLASAVVFPLQVHCTALELRIGKEACRVPWCLHDLEKDD